jgi:hypothetical protein
MKLDQWVTVLLACNADGSDYLPPLVIGKYWSPCCFKNVRNLPMKYVSINLWITSRVVEDYVT